jgi:hypothetical protein
MDGMTLDRGGETEIADAAELRDWVAIGPSQAKAFAI